MKRARLVRRGRFACARRVAYTAFVSRPLCIGQLAQPGHYCLCSTNRMAQTIRMKGNVRIPFHSDLRWECHSSAGRDPKRVTLITSFSMGKARSAQAVYNAFTCWPLKTKSPGLRVNRSKQVGLECPSYNTDVYVREHVLPPPFFLPLPGRIHGTHKVIHGAGCFVWPSSCVGLGWFCSCALLLTVCNTLGRVVSLDPPPSPRRCLSISLSVCLSVCLSVSLSLSSWDNRTRWLFVKH